ncbi:carboxypeptidase-like regulatory domain-containing protein [Algoriphagus hitonicola]|uniref:carboxypeptidase-like regulatory domain-containing protein n=1 Tax=Algoriphagus hitonicola TaxID=435880 RepID=UPI001C433701|nr:carboxypeptidase-like regulatory domain-containing protein [Algoriphagus hitonicola]
MLFSQNFSEQNKISGIVRNDSSPVLNAYIFLKNYPDFNTLSDSEGRYTLLFPENLRNDTLVISHIGYEQIEVSLANLNRSPNTQILKERTIGLEEILVVPEDKALKEMLQKAVLKIPENYPSKRHQLNGLFRQVSTNYDEFTQLIEAKVKIEDVGYTKAIGSAKIKIEELRKSDDLAEKDSTYIMFLRKFQNSQQAENQNSVAENQPIQLYESNLIRKNYLERSPLNINGFMNEFFGIIERPVYQELMGFELVDQDTIYQIAYGSTDPPIGTSYIKINSRDFAIVEFQVTRYMDPERESYEQFFMKYKKVNQKYYPEKLIHKVIRFINRNIGSHQMDIQTFYFDEVQTGKLKKIRNWEKELRDSRIDLNPSVYDSVSWKNSQYLKNHPLDSAIIKSLERFRSLDEQFGSNGKN